MTAALSAAALVAGAAAGWRAGYRAGLSKAVAVVTSEPELPGDEPPDFAASFDSARERGGIAEACRAIVRATKGSIVRRIREAQS